MVVLVLGDVICRWVVESSELFWEEIFSAREINDKMFLRDDVIYSYYMGE